MKTLLLLAALATAPSSALACEAFKSDDGMQITFESGANPTVTFASGAVNRFRAYGNGTEVRTLSAYPVDDQLDPEPIYFWVENAEDADHSNDILVWGDQRLAAACD